MFSEFCNGDDFDVTTIGREDLPKIFPAEDIRAALAPFGVPDLIVEAIVENHENAEDTIFYNEEIIESLIAHIAHTAEEDTDVVYVEVLPETPQHEIDHRIAVERANRLQLIDDVLRIFGDFTLEDLGEEGYEFFKMIRRMRQDLAATPYVPYRMSLIIRCSQHQPLNNVIGRV